MWKEFSPHNDCLAWFPSKDGLYSVKSGHWFLNLIHSQRSHIFLETSLNWSGMNAPKLSYWIWQTAWDWLPTNYKFHKRNLTWDIYDLLYMRMKQLLKRQITSSMNVKQYKEFVGLEYWYIAALLKRLMTTLCYTDGVIYCNKRDHPIISGIMKPFLVGLYGGIEPRKFSATLH